MTSDKSKDELLDIFGGNASKKVEPIDLEYNFDDDDVDLEIAELASHEPESDEIDDQDEIIELTPEMLEDEDNETSLDSAEDDSECENEPPIVDGESHWDSLAAELGLAENAVRPTTPAPARKKAKPKRRTEKPRSNAKSKQDKQASEGGNVLDDMFVARDQEQFERPSEPSFKDDKKKLDVNSVADEATDEVDDNFVEFEVEDFDAKRGAEISRPARVRRGQRHLDSDRKPKRGRSGGSSGEPRSERSKSRRNSEDDAPRNRKRPSEDRGERPARSERPSRKRDRDNEISNEDRPRRSRSRRDSERSDEERAPRGSRRQNREQETEGRSGNRKRSNDRDNERSQDRDRDNDHGRDNDRGRDRDRGRDDDRGRSRNEDRPRRDEGGSGREGRRRSRQPASDATGDGVKRKIPTWIETINDLIDQNLSSRKPSGRGRGGNGNRSGGNGGGGNRGGGKRRDGGSKEPRGRRGGSDSGRRRD